MEFLLNDLRFTLRQLARQRGYTAAAVLTLGLSLGATTAIFSVVSGVLLRPLDFPAPSELVAVCERHPSVEGFCIASPPDVEEWRVASRTLAQVGLGRDWTFRIAMGDQAEAVPGGLATAGFFAALGVRPSVGRLPTEDEFGPRRVALVSHALWRSFMGADSAAVGRTVMIDGEPVPVVGVLPASAEVPGLEYVRLWTSLPFDPRDEENRGWRGFRVIARLAPGVGRAAAAAELNGIARGLAERFPETNRGWSVDVLGLQDSLVGNVRLRLLVFLGAVGLVLLLGCANLANLTLARATHRAPELALRAAMGAGRGRLARLVLLESLLVSLAGMALGLPLASWGVDLFRALAPAGIPRLAEVGMDWRVLLFALGLTGLTTVLIGGAPALRGARPDLAPHLHSTRGSRTRGRGALVAVETAIAVMLLSGAALLGRAFARLTAWDPGFSPESRLVAWTGVSPGTYPTTASVRTLYAQALAAVAGLPGVQSVSLASAGPMFGGDETGTATSGVGADSAVVRWYDVGPGYFATLGVPIQAGRDFTADDRDGAPPVAIVNQTLARRLWPGRTPVGERLHMVRPEVTFTVVGVAADVAPFEPGVPAPPEVYWPFFQLTRWGAHVVVRTTGTTPGLSDAIRARLGEVSAELEPYRVSALRDLVGHRLVSPRFNALLLGSFAVVALLLAAVGIAGMVAYRVSHRLREVGIRMALGATGRDVVGEFVRETGVLVVAGIGGGTLAALAVTRLLRTMLAGTSPTDPAAFGTVVAGMLFIGLAAAWIPARRASRVAPQEALRAE